MKERRFKATQKCPRCNTKYTGHSDVNESYAKQGAGAQVAACLRRHDDSGSDSDKKDSGKKKQFTAKATCPVCKTVYTGYSDVAERYAKQGAGAQVATCKRSH